MGIKYNGVRSPFGQADETLALTATGAQAITVTDQLTLVDGGTVPATGARTINVTLGDDLQAGAMLIIQSKSDATEDNIFGTNITGPTVAGVAGKTMNFLFVYNGTAFVQAGLHIQID